MQNCVVEQIYKFAKNNAKRKNMQYIQVTENKKIKHILTKWNYVWLLYQALDKKTFGYPSLIETIYNMALGNDVASACSGQIKIYSSGHMDFGIKHFNYTKDSHYFDKFMKQLSEGIKDCEFTSVGITYINIDNNSAHRNMLLIYRINDQPHFYLFEPHGSGLEGTMYSNIRNFVSILVTKYNEMKKNEKNKLIKEEKIYQSCSRRVVNTLMGLFYKDNQDKAIYYETEYRPGIQGKVNEKKLGEGYCVMHSYFWLYLVLYCYKNNKNTTSIAELFDNVERYFAFVGESVLADAVNGFAIHVYNVYLTNIFLNSQKAGNNLLNQIEQYFIKSLYTDPDLSLETIVKEQAEVPGKELRKMFTEQPIEVTAKDLQQIFTEPKKFYDSTDFGIGLKDVE